MIQLQARNFIGNPLAFLIALLSFQFSSQLFAQQELATLEARAIQAAVDKVANAMVQIETVGGLELVGESRVSTSPKTGLVVDEDGYIVSSLYNFIDEPSAMFVRTVDGKRLAAEIICRDLLCNLVLLKTNAPGPLESCTAAVVENVKVGQRAIALGKVFDPVTPNLSVGIISAKNRVWSRAIQTDAKVSANNYGGPLIDLKGRVIGVLAPVSPRSGSVSEGAQWYDSGIGFAIPLEGILDRLPKMKTDAELKPGKLGIGLKGDDIYASPATVATCLPRSPAFEAGILKGDRIVEANGQSIDRQSQFKHAIGPLYAGDDVTIIVQRQGQEITTRVTLVSEIEPFVQPMIGILPDQTFGSSIGDENGKARVAGVRIRGLMNDGPAENAGLKVGDVITAFQGAEIADSESLADAIMNAQPQQLATVEFQRDQESIDAGLTLEKMTGATDNSIQLTASEKKSGTIEFKVPEEKNECFAIIPSAENPNSQILPSILVWVPTPGEVDQAAVLEVWQPWCNAANMIVMVPASIDSKRWLPGDVDFIKKATEQLADQFNADRTRISIGGDGAGVRLAAIAAFAHRELFAGLVFNEPLPSRLLRDLSPDPTKRLLLLAISKNENEFENLKSSVALMEQAEFPISSKSINDNDDLAFFRAVTTWQMTLDQL